MNELPEQIGILPLVVKCANCYNRDSVYEKNSPCNVCFIPNFGTWNRVHWFPDPIRGLALYEPNK